MRVPIFALPHKVKVYKYKGSGAYGPAWESEARTGRARLEPSRKVVTDREGSEVVSNTSGIFQPDLKVESMDKVEHNGREYFTIDAQPMDTHAGTHHIEAVLR